MSVETQLKAVLGPLVSGGCHNRVNTTSPAVLPYIVFYEVSGIPIVGISPGQITPVECMYQVDVFAPSPEYAKGLALGAVRDAIEQSAALQGTLVFKTSGDYSKIDKTYQYITQYKIWDNN